MVVAFFVGGGGGGGVRGEERVRVMGGGKRGGVGVNNLSVTGLCNITTRRPIGFLKEIGPSMSECKPTLKFSNKNVSKVI